MTRPTALIITINVLASLAVADNPDKISPVLLDEWSGLGSESMVSAIVHLTDQADVASLDAQLSANRATRALRHQVVIQELRRVAEVTQVGLVREMQQMIRTGEVAGYTPYWITNCLVVQGKKSALLGLSERSDVEWIEGNFRPELIAPRRSTRRPGALDENEGIPSGVRAVNAPRVWHELGFTGAGRLVANLDTGVDLGHPALGSRWRGHTEPPEECWLDVVETSTAPWDDVDHGHGTHVMGTMCGNSVVSNDSIGIAPGASWIAANGINQSASDTNFTNDVLTAFQWFADPDSNEFTLDDVPDVVQNSWGVHGGFPGFEDCYTEWNDAIVNCEAAGVVVVFSAGNEGGGVRTVRSPATVAIDSVTVFSVGAVDADSDTIPPYEVADFSSRGPSSCPPFTAIKPEVCAPGVQVYSSVPGTATIPNRYDRFDGTSMAGPHVAGIVALMREANPNAEAREIKSVLMRTAIDYGTEGQDNTYGFGFVDAYEAVLAIFANRAVLEGTITDGTSGDPIPNARVRAGEHFVRTTDHEGRYRLSVPGDSTWLINISAYGYYDYSESRFLAIEDTVTLDVALTRLPHGTIEGSLTTGADIPLPGATITYVGKPYDAQITDENGEFGRDVPGDSVYDLRVEYHDVELDTSFLVPVEDTTMLELTLTSPREDAQGPDNYGYRACDRFDNELAPTCDWVEITPARGGPGHMEMTPGIDPSVYIEMPFPFVFYGETFDTLTINENGWISPSYETRGYFVNAQIPNANGPSGMLALFWDPLFFVGDAEVSWWHDSLNCRLIVEYYRVRFHPLSEQVLTAQAQIYAPEARPTPTGDCEIQFLYEQLDPPYSPTVGIENPAESDGLQLLYRDEYAANTWLITEGSAVLFTTRTEPFAFGSVSGTVTAHPAPVDYTEVSISIGCAAGMPDAGGAYAISEVIAGDRSAMVFLPGYEQVATTVTIEENETAQLNFEIWRLDPPRDLEVSGQTDFNVTLIWSAPASVGGSLDEFREYRIFRNGALLDVTAETGYEDEVPENGLYDYHLVAVYEGGVSDTSNHAVADVSVGTDDDPAGLPTEFSLTPPYPNPFNATTRIEFALPRASRIELSVHDLLGRRTATLTDRVYDAGNHFLTWDADALPSGLYMILMQADGFREVRKALLVK